MNLRSFVTSNKHQEPNSNWLKELHHQIELENKWLISANKNTKNLREDWMNSSLFSDGWIRHQLWNNNLYKELPFTLQRNKILSWLRFNKNLTLECLITSPEPSPHPKIVPVEIETLKCHTAGSGLLIYNSDSKTLSTDHIGIRYRSRSRKLADELTYYKLWLRTL
jgi:hypothetical protein